jgi:hypothetical protein
MNGQLTNDEVEFLLCLWADAWASDVRSEPFAHEDFWPNPATEWAP